MTFRKLFDLESFKRDVPLLTIGELAAKYGISKASVSRLKFKVARESQPADNPEQEAAEEDSGAYDVTIDNPEQEAAEEDSGAYDVTISIPISCLDDFLGTTGLDELRTACFDLDSQDKALLVQSILQARVSSSLPPADVGIPVIANQGETYA